MELFKLTVTPVSNVLPPSNANYSITANSETGSDKWSLFCLGEANYRTAISATGLTAAQIEEPIRTGSMTTFGGRGHGDMVFREDVLVKMGLRKQKA